MNALVAVHTLISLVAIVLGAVAVRGLSHPGASPYWTSGFLVLALATTATGFLLPYSGVTPAVATGIVATVVLAVVLIGRLAFGLRGRWRPAYAGGVVVSLYLLVFVGIAQAFQKIPPLHALAPTGTGPVFAASQLVVLGIFIALGISAVRGFKPMTPG